MSLFLLLGLLLEEIDCDLVESLFFMNGGCRDKDESFSSPIFRPFKGDLRTVDASFDDTNFDCFSKLEHFPGFGESISSLVDKCMFREGGRILFFCRFGEDGESDFPVLLLIHIDSY